MNRIGPSKSELFLANADGTGERPLLAKSGFDYNASFSADGQWIVFTSEPARTITISSLGPRPWLATALLAVASVAFGHAGFNHVMGTVAKISGNVLTVITAKGNVDVKLGQRTDLTRNGQKAAVADLKPGTRIVAEVPQGSNDNVAESVKIGATKTAAAKVTRPTNSQLAAVLIDSAVVGYKAHLIP